MAILIRELQEILIKQCSEEDIIEYLDLSTEDIVNAFVDRIEERQDYIIKELDLEEDDEA